MVTYAFVDFSQHKFDALSGDGIPDDNYQITLVNKSDPDKVRGWNFTSKPSIDNAVSISASATSKPALTGLINVQWDTFYYRCRK